MEYINRFFTNNIEIISHTALGVLWIAHIFNSIKRLRIIVKSADMRLNIRFVEKGQNLEIAWRKVIQQCVISVLIIAYTLLVLV
jgi:hypothetical protein